MFCPKCGSENKGNTKFCGKCGTALGSAALSADKAVHSQSKGMKAWEIRQTASNIKSEIQKWLSRYMDTWRKCQTLGNKEKNLWFGIHVGAALFFCGIVILLAVTGGSKVPEEMENMAPYVREGREDAEEIPENENVDVTAEEYEESAEETAYTALEVEGGNCKAGNTCIFGSYPMNEGASSKEGIEWIILEVRDNKILVLSKYVLPELRAFNNVIDLKTITRWDGCSLRTWLNGSFYDDAFTEEQKSAIVTSQIGDYDNRMGGSSNYTQDKVFCLSVKEAKLYNSSLVGTFYDTGNPMTWWLRTEAETDFNNMGKYTAFVTAEGFVKTEGFHNYQEIGVRPAMWIDLDMVSVVSY